MALTPKAKARGWASAFLGHELTDDECDRIADNFDAVIVGKRARVSWKIEEKANGTRIRFALLRPLLVKPAAAPKPPVTTVAANGATTSVTYTTPAATGAESAADRRARLMAELAAMEDGGEAEAPF